MYLLFVGEALVHPLSVNSSTNVSNITHVRV